MGLGRFQEVCDVFDEVDALLRAGNRAFGMQYAESGLDVAFDQASIIAYEEAMESAEKFEQFVERLNYMNDRHANMDY